MSRRGPPPNAAALALQLKFKNGLALHQQGRFAEAESIYEAVLARQPKHADALHLLGVVALQTGRTERAVELIGKAIALDPKFAIAHNNLAKALNDLKQHEAALASCDRAIALKPDYEAAHNNRGIALVNMARAEDALASYDRAIALSPNHTEAHNNRGIAFLNMARAEDALASYDKAIALNPDYAEAHSNRGNALRALGRPAEAIASYDKAIALTADYAEAHWNRGLCSLQLGRLEEGWRGYEWRKRRTPPIATRPYSQPSWLGEESVSGKTVFLWWEQGLGDTIQFCRYANMVEAKGARVILSVQQPLRELLRQLSPTIAIVGPDETPTEFDYHCPLMSLPPALRTTLETIPAQASYLRSDAERRATWEARLSPRAKPRIGLVWSGSKSHRDDRNRSVKLERLLPLCEHPADWISLQYEVRDDDAELLRRDDRIRHFGSQLKDFSDTAALVDLMDVVITVDTSVAHLAGALGKPVWVLLPFDPDWRWLLGRGDSPWYPSARLFRQQRIGDWQELIERVARELRSRPG